MAVVGSPRTSVVGRARAEFPEIAGGGKDWTSIDVTMASFVFVGAG